MIEETSTVMTEETMVPSNIRKTVTNLFLLFTFICAIITTYVALTGFEIKHKQLMFGLSIAQGVTVIFGLIWIARALWSQAGYMTIRQEANRLYWMRVTNFFYLVFYLTVFIFAFSVYSGTVLVGDLKKQIIG